MARGAVTSSPTARAARRASLLGGYAPLAGVHDELMTADGQVRPHWGRLLDAWTSFAPDEMRRRLGVADRHLSDAGVSYRIGGEASLDDMFSGERPWPISHLPLPIGEAEWRRIEAGVTQRATLTEAVLRDLYGPASLVSSGVLPAAAVTGSPDYLRPLIGAEPPGGRHLHIYACDLGRAPDGSWWVLGDRTQAPSGAGYALENRLAMARAFPDLFQSLHVTRLAAFFQGFRAGLVKAAERADPRICLLTPGPLSETYFEQAYLARYLGFLLVEGGDLVMRDGKVFVRTIAGLKRADVVWRRIDGDFADPLELNAASRLGVAGLVQAVREGSVVLANSLGSGVVESRALMSFLPALARHVLGEDLILPNVATWWCGQPAERETVLSQLERMAVAPAFRPAHATNDNAPRLPGEVSPAEREALARMIAQRGVDYVGQEIVHLSTMPVLVDGRLEPRPFTLRVYAAATPDGWRVMPGGFCRMSDRQDARAVSMQQGALSSDVWVLSDRPVDQTTLLPAPDQVAIRRKVGNLPSRAADNLFWLGRYLERAEGTLRLTRALIGRMVDDDERRTGHIEAVRRLAGLLMAWGATPAVKPSAPRPPLIQIVNDALHGPEQYGSAASSLREARRTASVIRERLSMDSWRLIGDLTRRLDRPGAGGQRSLPTEGEAYETADRALRALSAFSGLAHENMIRGDGWRFLQIGRRLERALTTCRYARHFGEGGAPAECLDVLLDLIDAQITYRSRYLIGVAHGPVLDLALFDQENPRSVAFQIERLDREVTELPALQKDGLIEPPRRLSIKLAADVATMRAEDADRAFIVALEQRLMALSDAVAGRYFLQTPVDAGSP
jgi:uncharacterized circularly permuted ATP-grasp superfamily protein/uncharacterized alpha-E superfamily protein